MRLRAAVTGAAIPIAFMAAVTVFATANMHAALIVFVLALAGIVLLQSFLCSRALRQVSRRHAAFTALHAHCPTPGPGPIEDPHECMTPENAVVRMMAGLTAVLDPVAEAAHGFRLTRENEGWSDHVAEQMGLMVYAAGQAQVTGTGIRIVSHHHGEE